jgi:drug/metabolite transporter (DMT)-like permease
MTPRHLALLGALAAIWGASYLLIKYALEGFAPAEIVFLRTALASVVLLGFIWAQGRATRAELGHALRRPGMAVLLGSIAIAAPFLLITFGELVVPSGLTAVLITPASLFVAMLAPFLDESERINRMQTIGLLLGLVGVGLLVGVESVGSLDEFLGALAMLGAAFFYAVSNYVVKGPFGRYPALVTSWVSVSVGALLVLPVAIATADHDDVGTRAVLAVVALGVLGTALAFVIFYLLIAEIGAGRASLVSYLAPPAALAYGALLLDEPITIAAVGGLILIFGGVALASRRQRAPAAPEPATPPEGSCTATGSAALKARRLEPSLRVGDD